MRWNAENAFIGKLEPGEFDSDGMEFRSCLTWPCFMVSPLLPPGGNVVRFSGHFRAGDNSKDKKIGIWVDAFAHHVVIDSQYTLCITDIEGGSPSFS
jgi:hypothetical protein